MRYIRRGRIKLFTICLLCFFAGTLYAGHDNLLKQKIPLTIATSFTEAQIGVAEIPLYFSPYVDKKLDAQYAHLFFDPLVRWSINKKIELRLIKDWQQLETGVRRFNLKKNVVFHSGNVLTSNDVIWTLTQIRLNRFANEFFSKIINIKQVNQHTFDIYSDLTNTQLLDYLTHFFVLDKNFYEQRKIDFNSVQAIIPLQSNELILSGTGPYQVKQYNPVLHLRVAHNPHYWGGSVDIAGLNFIKIRSVDSRLYALLADDIEIAESVAKKNIDTVHFAPNKELVEVVSSDVVFLTINDKRSEILQRSAVREAIRLLINEAGMLKHIANGLGSVRKYFMPIEHIDGFELDYATEYDINKAKQILSKFDMPAHLTLLVLVDPTGNTLQVADALTNMLKRIGVSLKVTEVTSYEKWDDLFYEYDFSLSTWQTPLLDRENIYQSLFTHSPLHLFLDGVFKQDANATSLQSSIALYREIEKEHRVIPLLFLNKIWATDEKFNLSGIFSVNSIPYWHLLTTNKRK